MQVKKLSVRRIIRSLNNADDDGGLWLPNIQRPFVWSEEQTCRLFDSIMREYPISTMLVWRTDAPIKCRKFIDGYRHEYSERLSDFFVPVNSRKKGLVLDGQQRLQSLFIGLAGSHEGRELYFDLLSGDAVSPDDVKYKFAFRKVDADERVPPQLRRPRRPAYWIRIKDLVFGGNNPVTEANRLLENCPVALDDDGKARVAANVGQVFKTFQSDDVIVYQELDSIDAPELYTDDDVVEVFIRANSGGTTLTKSDLLFSLLSASWDQSNERMEELLDGLNRSGFDFDRDFILKACLVVLDQGARYEVDKFRNQTVRELIEVRWDEIAVAISDVTDRVKAETYIRSDKALPSYNALLPLIYSRFQFPGTWDSASDISSYLLRALLAGSFNATPDQLLDQIIAHLRERRLFSGSEVLDVIYQSGRPVEISEDRLWAEGYGSKNVHLIMNLLYERFNYTPLYRDNAPQIDHIFPQSALSKVKMANPATGLMNLMRYKKPVRDQIANCMLLTARENGFQGKSDQLPDQWFAGKQAAYLEAHMIPQDPDLWRIARFEDFAEARKRLIRTRLEGFLLLRPEAVGVE